MYYPLAGWTSCRCGRGLPVIPGEARDAYELGLIRSEAGIRRGAMVNGLKIDAGAQVTRAKAAKTLYFMWVLAQPPKA